MSDLKHMKLAYVVFIPNFNLVLFWLLDQLLLLFSVFLSIYERGLPMEVNLIALYVHVSVKRSIISLTVLI